MILVEWDGFYYAQSGHRLCDYVLDVKITQVVLRNLQSELIQYYSYGELPVLR